MSCRLKSESMARTWGFETILSGRLAGVVGDPQKPRFASETSIFCSSRGISRGQKQKGRVPGVMAPAAAKEVLPRGPARAPEFKADGVSREVETGATREVGAASFHGSVENRTATQTRKARPQILVDPNWKSLVLRIFNGFSDLPPEVPCGLPRVISIHTVFHKPIGYPLEGESGRISSFLDPSSRNPQLLLRERNHRQPP